MRMTIIKILFLGLAIATPAFGRESNCFAIKNCRIFNGETMQFGSVLVLNGEIVEVGENIVLPANIKIIDGSNKTLLPGLIDSHVHIWNEYQLEQSLIFGITHLIDMFMDPPIMNKLKKRLTDPSVHNLAGLSSAGMLATAPNGHGTQFGVEVPTLTSPDQARSWVEKRKAEGSDFIKIIVEDGNDKYKFPSLDMTIVKALIKAAHGNDLLAIVHIFDLKDALAVINAGADGLAHLYADGGLDPEFGIIAAKHNIFVIPTFSVLQSACGAGDIGELISDLHLAPYLTPVDINMLKRTFPYPAGNTAYENAEKAMRQLVSANVPILAGTDAPNPGTTYGSSLHRELMLLVKAGLSPLKALRAATSIPAKKFNLKKQGFIKKGMKADLILIEGNPVENIKATRNIVAVWKNGFKVDREAFRKEVGQF